MSTAPIASSSTKRVHFAKTLVTASIPPEEYNEEVPRTPSPTWSDDSLPDTSSPSTPPSGSSAGRKDLPIVEGVTVAVHPLLEYNLYTRFTPLDWDLAQALSTITIREGRRDVKGKGKALVPADLAHPVTDPGLQEMDIQINGLTLWRPVQLSKAKLRSKAIQTGSPSSKNIPRGPLTLGEMLLAVHDFLMTSVSRREYEAVSPAVQQSVWMAFTARCKAAGDGEEEVRKMGLKRVDFLGANTQFATLARSKDSRLWVLHTMPQTPLRP